MNSDHLDESKIPLCSSPASDDDSFLDIEQTLGQRRFSPRFSYGYFLLNATILVFSLVFFGLSMRQRPWMGCSEANAIKETSYYSPLFDQIDIRLESVQINGTLLDTHPPSIYRQDPSPAVDAAWDRIANVRTSAISRDDVIKLGKDPSIAAKYPPSFGFGPDAFIAEIDVFHQIHCLDSLRREIFFDHYHGSRFPDGKPSELHKQHTSHCIYILLQNLMCSASIDVITHRWLDVQKHPFPDFNIEKKCRNFDDVLAWQEKHIADDTPYHLLRRPADMEPVKTSDEFKDIFHQWNYAANDDLHVH